MQTKSHWVVRLLYNNNPFYLISGLIVLYALNSNAPGTHSLENLSQNGSSILTQSVQLAGWMSGYALLMAVTAILVVRVAKIWEDARTIYLVVTLAIVGMSVVFDQLCIQNWGAAAMLLSAGLVFSIGLVEATLVCSKLQLPKIYKVICYSLFAAFFAMPIVISSRFAWVEALGGFNVLLFPLVTGLILLGLIPAIRKGRLDCDDNGSPWKWPYYPWSLFVILFVAIVFRSSALAVSFGPMEDTGLFINTLFLLPLALALFVLLIEISLVEGLTELRRAILFFSPSVLLLGMGAEIFDFQSSIIGIVESNIASPTIISGWCLVGLLVYFFQRGVQEARFAISATIFVFGFSTAQSPMFASSSIGVFVAVTFLTAIPLAIELTHAITCKAKAEFSWTSSGVFLGYWIYATLGVMVSNDYLWIIGICATITWWMVIGLYFDSEWMKFIRTICAMAIGCGILMLIWAGITDQLHPVAVTLMSAAGFVGSITYWKFSKRQGWRRLSIANGLAVVLVQLSMFKEQLTYAFSNGDNLAILGGAICFLFGAGITMVKAGALGGLRDSWSRRSDSLLPGF